MELILFVLFVNPIIVWCSTIRMGSMTRLATRSQP